MPRLLVALLLIARAAAGQQDPLPLVIHKLADREQATAFGFFGRLHGLTSQEKSAQAVARAFEDAGLRVVRGVAGAGLVASLENGKGPVILLRAELDAGVPDRPAGLAARDDVRARVAGHDLHLAMLLGTARVLDQVRPYWRGRVVILAEPDTASGSGARAIVKDRLLERFGPVDQILGVRVDPSLPVGRLGYSSGAACALRETVVVKFRGRQGPVGSPRQVNPLGLAASLVTQLPIVATRDADPRDRVLLLAGDLQVRAGAGPVPEQASLVCDLRCFDEGVKQQLLAGLERRARAVARAAGLQEQRMPSLRVLPGGLPATLNDPALAGRLLPAFTRYLGLPFMVLRSVPPSYAPESLGILASSLPRGSGAFLARIGCSLAEHLPPVAKTTPAPLGSRAFAPVPRPTITFGVRALCGAVLELLKKTG